MTSYDTSGNVETMVEAISPYTIGTAGTITDAAFVLFLANADTQVTADDPGFTQAQANEANALLVCHYIARRLGKTGKTSESLGRGSYSKQLASGLTSWLDEYNALVARVLAVSTTEGLQSMSSSGLTRDDATMRGLALDQSTPYDLTTETRDE